MKNVGKQGKQKCPELIINKTTIHNPTEVAKSLNSYFTQIAVNDSTPKKHSGIWQDTRKSTSHQLQYIKLIGNKSKKDIINAF